MKSPTLVARRVRRCRGLKLTASMGPKLLRGALPLRRRIRECGPYRSGVREFEPSPSRRRCCMRSALTVGRAVLGGYIAIHGAQKLFGAMDGPGLDAAGAGFHAMGLTPGRQFAALAAGSELVGGVL